MSILFEHLFWDIILERGHAYYLDGCVMDLEIVEHQVYATVRGSQDYLVYIELKGDGIEDLSCECPHFAGGNNCKHLAALFYALSEAEATSEGLGVQSDIGAALEILESLPSEEIVDFLKHELQVNETLNAKFMAKYQERSTCLGESLYLRQIDSIFSFHLGRTGFIKYHQVSAFSHDTAFTLVKHLVSKVSTLEIDDSDGTTGWIMGELVRQVSGRP